MIRSHVVEWMNNAPAMPNALVADQVIREAFSDKNDRRLAWVLWNTPRHYYPTVVMSFHHADRWNEMMAEAT